MPPKRLSKISNDKKVVDKKNAKNDKSAAATGEYIVNKNYCRQLFVILITLPILIV